MPIGRLFETVKVAEMIFAVGLLEHVPKLTEIPVIVTVQEGVFIINDAGKIRSILGVTPSGCPITKLNVYDEVLDIIEVSESKTALEKLNDVATALTVWVSCIYSELPLLNRKDSTVGV